MGIILENYGGGDGGSQKVEVIHFGTYNIQNGRNGGLGSVLHKMAQANVHLGLL